MNFVGLAALVLVCAGLYDWFIAQYVMAVEARHGHLAGMWSGLTYAVGLVGTVGILKVSLWLAPFEIVGLYLGTFYAVSRRRAREHEEA